MSQQEGPESEGRFDRVFWKVALSSLLLVGLAIAALNAYDPCFYQRIQWWVKADGNHFPRSCAFVAKCAFNDGEMNGIIKPGAPYIWFADENSRCKGPPIIW